MRMLSGERVLTASHDGSVKMWDVRTDTCVATVGRCSSAVLCMEYDDSSGILAAAGRDAYVLSNYFCYTHVVDLEFHIYVFSQGCKHLGYSCWKADAQAFRAYEMDQVCKKNLQNVAFYCGFI